MYLFPEAIVRRKAVKRFVSLLAKLAKRLCVKPIVVLFLFCHVVIKLFAYFLEREREREREREGGGGQLVEYKRIETECV